MANEKRLIDANALIEEYDRVHVGEPGKARKLIEDAPTVDAVEIVRCRDCVKGYIDLTFRDDKTWCVKFGKDMDLDGFCSYGERKDGDGNG